VPTYPTIPHISSLYEGSLAQAGISPAGRFFPARFLQLFDAVYERDPALLR